MQADSTSFPENGQKKSFCSLSALLCPPKLQLHGENSQQEALEEYTEHQTTAVFPQGTANPELTLPAAFAFPTVPSISQSTAGCSEAWQASGRTDLGQIIWIVTLPLKASPRCSCTVLASLNEICNALGFFFPL